MAAAYDAGIGEHRDLEALKEPSRPPADPLAAYFSMLSGNGIPDIGAESAVEISQYSIIIREGREQ